ncbi:MAG TPA: prolipoprotein diacylglyceryl transferase [Microbacteriaceae bacterium]|nr:prolipoprotein diacylglyceryl transferase [Microbacteriaceae bacterium]
MIVASIPSPTVSYWDIPLFGLNLRVHAYALLILTGILVATVWTSRRLTRRGAEPGIVLDFVLWAVPLGIIGARVYHVLTHPADFFGPGMDPWGVVQIWNGGNAIFGALIGGGIGVWIACRQTGIRFLSFADALVPGLLAAQAIGRIGNYVNQELFGLPTNAPWGLEIDPNNPVIPSGLPAGTLFHPTFLYELLWNALGVIVLLAIERRLQLRWGRLFALYLVWYGAGRSFFESIRIDPSEMFFGIRTNIWAAWIAVIVGIVLFVLQARRHPGLETRVYRPGREWPRTGVDSAELDTTTVEPDADSAVAQATSPR